MAEADANSLPPVVIGYGRKFPKGRVPWVVALKKGNSITSENGDVLTVFSEECPPKASKNLKCNPQSRET